MSHVQSTFIILYVRKSQHLNVSSIPEEACLSKMYFTFIIPQFFCNFKSSGC